MSARGRWGLFLTTTSLILWGGGLVLLGAVVAPRVFFGAGLARPEAAAVMAPIFRAFDRWVLFCMALLIGGEYLRITGARPGRAALAAGLALAGLLLAIGAGSALWVNPRIEALRLEGVHPGVGPEGLRFERLHRTSERGGHGAVFLCAALLVVSWLPGEKDDR